MIIISQLKVIRVVLSRHRGLSFAWYWTTNMRPPVCFWWSMWTKPGAQKPQDLFPCLCLSPSIHTLLWGWSRAAHVPVCDALSWRCPLCHRGRELPASRRGTGSPCEVSVRKHPGIWWDAKKKTDINQGKHFRVLLVLFPWSIHDFQVSGPPNMTKVFTDETNGKAKVALKWTPLAEDLHRFIPVCFTAETNETWVEGF